MKLHFEPDLDYQRAAVEAVCDLFRDQETCRTEFTVTQGRGQLGFLGAAESDLGIGNRLTLLDDQLLENLRAVQLRNGLRPDESLRSKDFTVEMETGTGKTYVYLRTIYELNRRYGFSKFVIVVPSVAIKEGVYKTLQITRDHFAALYGGVPCEFFLYDSSKLGQVRGFATSANLQVMVVTVGAINKKDVNNLYKPQEKTGGEEPVRLIQATRPVVIVDEPQSVDGGLGGQGKQALAAMSPLCTLRYSATHADKHHMVYRLDAVDAYERGLVKQIEVASLEIEGGYNRPYIKLVSTSNIRGNIKAKVEVDVQQKKGVARKTVTVGPDDDLEQATGRDLYANCLVRSINCKPGDEAIELSTLSQPLRLGEAIGAVDGDQIRRQMIRQTIVEHLDKELRLTSRGVKVLSLFFIDAVEHYRRYENGAPVKGKYAVMFEEEYKKAIETPKYSTLFRDVDTKSLPAAVHDGYFSIDKKGHAVDTGESNQVGRDNAERGYALIMKDKERLLGFQTPLKFIFSHSALREGWDNPNVFQICTLREMGTERERRQTLGRGLRLCVDQAGQRLRDRAINTLTVIAAESYEEFAANLQHEIEEDTGIRFGVVARHQFATVLVPTLTGDPAPLGVDQSEAIWEHLAAQGHINAQGEVQDSLRTAIKEDAVTLPAGCIAPLSDVVAILRKLASGLDVKDGRKRHTVKVRHSVLDGEPFRALWDRIKDKTTYRVDFDNAALIAACTKAVAALPVIPPTRLQLRTADLTIDRGGVTAEATSSAAPIVIAEPDLDLPDLLTFLQNQTRLTRRSLVKILVESGRLDDFRVNPQRFIALVAEAVNRAKQLAVVDGIRYQRVGDDAYYAQELFEQNELTSYLKNMVEAQKSIHEQVIYDSEGVERVFAEQLEQNGAVKVYAKLPGWFTVPTPLGTYNPDWAVLVDDGGAERLYFVVETKSSLFAHDLRAVEGAKIACGKAHFAALTAKEPAPRYVVARTLSDVFSTVPSPPSGGDVTH